MKTEKYKVTDMFGLSPIGEIRKCFVLSIDNDTGYALIYHPKEKSYCGSFEICRKVSGYWVGYDEKNYINVGDVAKEFKPLIKEMDKEKKLVIKEQNEDK